MGLILCDFTVPENPLYIDALSLNIYSFEELCYLIYENPILVTEGIVNDKLVNFIENELQITALASSIKKKRNSGGRDDEILISIIEYCDLYNNSEAISFRNALTKLKKMTDAELLKLRADYMFYIGKYGLSKKYYLAILDLENKPESVFLGSVYHNLGVDYANLFLYEEAHGALKKAYELTSDDGILMEIYFLNKVFQKENIDSIEKDEALKGLFKSELIAECENNFNIAVNGVREGAKLQKIQNIFKTENKSVRKKLIGEYIDRWKKEYRNMK